MNRGGGQLTGPSPLDRSGSDPSISRVGACSASSWANRGITDAQREGLNGRVRLVFNRDCGFRPTNADRDTISHRIKTMPRWIHCWRAVAGCYNPVIVALTA